MEDTIILHIQYHGWCPSDSRSQDTIIHDIDLIISASYTTGREYRRE